MKSLMERLLEAGYPSEEMYHHCSDLYVFVTPITEKVVGEWAEETNCKSAVSIFKDQVTGKPMYDCAFQYVEYFNRKELEDTCKKINEDRLEEQKTKIEQLQEQINALEEKVPLDTIKMGSYSTPYCLTNILDILLNEDY